MLDVSSLALHMPASLTDTFRILDLCGVLLNGILGGLIARRKNFDLVGFVVLAMLTATAGGILRDVMIQAGPPFALTDPYYLYTACLGATVAWFVPLTSRPTRRLLVVADAHAMLVSTAVGAGLCVLAYWRSWQLPVISDRERRRAGRRTGPGALVGWRRALMMGPLKAPAWRGRGGRVTDGSTPSGQPEQG